MVSVTADEWCEWCGKEIGERCTREDDMVFCDDDCLVAWIAQSPDDAAVLNFPPRETEQ